jgi:hypothetical protein
MTGYGPVAACCKCCDEPSTSGAMELVNGKCHKVLLDGLKRNKITYVLVLSKLIIIIIIIIIIITVILILYWRLYTVWCELDIQNVSQFADDSGNCVHVLRKWTVSNIILVAIMNQIVPIIVTKI